MWIKTKKFKTASCRLSTLFVAAFAAYSASAESLFRFEFNEGSGTVVTNVEGTLTGHFLKEATPENYPARNTDSPSGAANDSSLTIVDPDGYLVLDTAGIPAFADFTKPITAEAWIRIPAGATPRPEGIVGFGDSWKLGLRADGQVAFTLFGVIDANSGIFPQVDVWTHIASVWVPGVGITFFQDGVEVGFLEETRPMRAARHTFLGIGSAGLSEAVNASVDRVRVHQAALAAEELDSVAALPKAPLASTLASFNLNETTPPYRSEGLAARETRFAQDLVIANGSPTITNSAPSKKVGDFALTFDGNDRIRVSDPAQVVTLESGDFTVQGWVKPGTMPGARGVVFFNNGPGGAISFSVTADRHVFVTTLGIADTRSAAVIPDDGLWHHIAVVHRNGEDLRFYVDGILGDTIPYTQGVIKTRTDNYFVIGAEPTGGLAYSGGLDRLQLLNEALTPDKLDYLAVPGVNPEAPELEITTAVALSWPTEATGFILQSTTDLTEPRVWTNVPFQPVVMNDRFFTLTPAPAQKTFYRLIRPPTQ